MGCNSSQEQEQAEKKQKGKRKSHLEQCTKIVLTPNLYQYNVGACGTIMSMEMALLLQTRNKDDDIYEEEDEFNKDENRHYISIPDEKKKLDDVLQTGMASIYESHIHTALFDVVERPRYKGFKVLESKFDVSNFEDIANFIKEKGKELKKEISFILTQNPETILVHLLYRKEDSEFENPIPIIFDAHSRFELQLKVAHMLYLKDIDNLTSYMTFLWDMHDVQCHVVQYTQPYEEPAELVSSPSNKSQKKKDKVETKQDKGDKDEESSESGVVDEVVAAAASDENMINSEDVEPGPEENINDVDSEKVSSRNMGPSRDEIEQGNNNVLNMLMGDIHENDHSNANKVDDKTTLVSDELRSQNPDEIQSKKDEIELQEKKKDDNNPFASELTDPFQSKPPASSVDNDDNQNQDQQEED